jgi:hypothetical protein
LISSLRRLASSEPAKVRAGGVTDITGSGIFVLLPELPLCDEQRRQKNSSIAMSSFDELAEMKTAVSKQQLHFKQRQK